MNTCKSCCFFDLVNETEYQRTHVQGYCRINPPTVVVGGMVTTQWPEVKKDDWCGKHCTEEDDYNNDMKSLCTTIERFVDAAIRCDECGDEVEEKIHVTASVEGFIETNT